MAVNRELILFYWGLGKTISLKLSESNWSDKILATLSKDLKSEFPESKGFSERNLKYAKYFYEFYSSAIVQRSVAQLQDTDLQTTSNDIEFRQQLVAQIPWGAQYQDFYKSKKH